MVPPGSNTDEWVAGVTSYIWNSFDNSASFINKDDAAQARKTSGARNTPWKVDEIVAATSARTVVDEDEQGRAMEGVLGLQSHTSPPMKLQFKNLLFKKV